MFRRGLAVVLTVLMAVSAFAQNQEVQGDSAFVKPTTDATFHVILLIESDDQHRTPYDGPARAGLTTAGYDRLVVAGSATAMVTVGKQAVVAGASRYGHLTVSTSILNTTEDNEVQVKVSLQAHHQSPTTVDTTARAPMGRWFLIGSAGSLAGQPKHAADGKRAVAIMQVNDGVLVLD